MKKLKKLLPNSTLGIVSPASYESKEKILYNVKKFEKLGYNVVLGKHLFERDGYLAGNDYNRAEDLMNMFLDKSIDGIICYRGGFGSIRMINFLDFHSISKNPKVFCGYSDITLLINNISHKCSFPCFHAPMINSDFSDSLTTHFFINILNSNISTYYLNNFKDIKIINPKNFKGEICGGNLSIICSSLSTPYSIETNNKILLLEDVNEQPYVIDRLLSQLIASNKLSSCKALILGHFTDCSAKDHNSFTVEEILTNKLSNLNIPIIYNFPCGHNYPNITLPIGANMSFNSNENTFTIEEDIFE